MSAKNKKIQLYLRRLIRELCGAPDVDINDALAGSACSLRPKTTIW